jgi:L-amino acid N-acyltransferase YncA
MPTIDVREARREDAGALAELLNAIIARGGTTAHEDPFTPERLADAYIDGPGALCCFVAVDRVTGRIEGFQALGRDPGLAPDIGDIGTFARVGGTQRGTGSALFAATRARALDLGLAAINATIRADNAGGLAFYAKQGFQDDSVTPAVPLRDGSRVDRVHKRFALKPGWTVHA